MKRILRIAAAFGAGMMLASVSMADTPRHGTAAALTSAEIERQTTAVLDLAQCVLPHASNLDAALATGTYASKDEATKKSMNEAAMEVVKCSLTFKRTYIGKSM